MIEEGATNTLGYTHLGAGRIDEAIAVFELNCHYYPESANVWDSLGEACMKKGDLEAAIAHYERAVELDPRNEAAREHIATMHKELETPEPVEAGAGE